MQLTESCTAWANNQWIEHKHPSAKNKNKHENVLNELQNSHLEETSRRLRQPGECSFLTQEQYPDDNWEDTAQPRRIQKKRVQTQSLRQNGYLGEIRFESRKGEKHNVFPVFADSAIGIRQNAQTILVDQEWDEDIETDESCKRKATHKCMQQLSTAIRNQREGINPTKKQSNEYEQMDLEKRFAQENMQIAFDYQIQQQQQESRQNDSYGSQEEEQLITSMSAVNKEMDHMLQNHNRSNNAREIRSRAAHNNLSQQSQQKHIQQQNNIPPFADTVLSQSSFSPSYHNQQLQQEQMQHHQPSSSRIYQTSIIAQQFLNDNDHLSQESAGRHSQRDSQFEKQMLTLDDIIEMETILDQPQLIPADVNSPIEYRSFEGHGDEEEEDNNLEEEYHDTDDYCNTAEDSKSKEEEPIEEVFPPPPHLSLPPLQGEIEDDLAIMMNSIGSQESFLNSRIELHTQQTYHSAYQFSDFQDVSFSI